MHNLGGRYSQTQRKEKQPEHRFGAEKNLSNGKLGVGKE
jgi:hypothetical protein